MPLTDTWVGSGSTWPGTKFALQSTWPGQLDLLMFLFICVEASRPSQQFFSHVGTKPTLPGFNEGLSTDGLRTQLVTYLAPLITY